MIRYVESFSAKQVLSPKRHTINEMFLASYHLRSYGGCEFGCPYCDGLWAGEKEQKSQIQVFTDYPKRLAQELETISPREVLGLTHGEPYQPIESRYRVYSQKPSSRRSAHKKPCGLRGYTHSDHHSSASIRGSRDIDGDA